MERGNIKILSHEDKMFKKKSPQKAIQKEKEKKRSFKYMFNKIRLKKCASATISKPLPTYQVAYLGNVVTGWAKGEGCIEKPLATLWRNYIQSSRPDVNMHLTVAGGGLKAVTKNHGLTEYWAHRLTTCSAPHQFPRIFCWVYRHEGRKLKHELRCHAALCPSSEVAAQIEKELKEFLTQALIDFKRDKLSRQNARLSLVNSVNENPSLPRRKILLRNGSHNYRPPLECSKSAPKLSSIEEIYGEEEDDGDLFNTTQQIYRKILKSYDNANNWFEHGKYQLRKKTCQKWEESRKEKKCDTINEAFKRPKPLNIETEDKSCDRVSFKDKVVDFKIGGEVSATPIINKGFIEQEQVSLLPVGDGEPQTDFSSLKVYKKRTLCDGNKDFSLYLSSENMGQLESIFQAHCSFNGGVEEDMANKLGSTLLV